MDYIEEKKTIDWLFGLGMFIKAFIAIFAIGSGVMSLFLTTNEVLHVTQLLVQGKLAADPDNFLANYILDLGFSFMPGQTNLFLFSYLVGHGIVNLFLVIVLLWKKLWAYPLSIIIFGAFAIYEGWQVYLTHSPFLAAFTIFDLAVIWLVWREYRYVKRNKHHHVA
jgi:uncharacterized membrane protein